MRSVRIVGAECGPFEVALLDGSDDAFAKAIAVRAELAVDDFYLSVGGAEGPVIPLTAALPESVTELHLHISVARSLADANAEATAAKDQQPIIKRRFSASSGEETVEWTTQGEQVTKP